MTIMGIFKRFKRWRKTRKQLRELHDIGTVFHSLDQLENGGMISIDERNRRLFIEEPLAMIMMAGGANKWDNFIRNCFTWLYHRQCTEAWKKHMLKEELTAVRLAAKKHTAMTRADIERIRHARRDEILQSDIEPPKVEAFEFFIVRVERNEDGEKKVVPAGDILAVGSYDPESERLELASWEEVSLYLNKEDKAKKKGKK